MKRALIFDPYLDTLGGGERYCLTFARVLSGLGYSVDLAWKNEADLAEAERRFGLDLSTINLDQQAWHECASHSSLIKRYQFTSRYDLIFWVSDGSLPFLFSKKNLIHFQVPFTHIDGTSKINKLKLKFINKLVYNSNFTRGVIERSLPSSKGVVLYPPIDTDQFRPGKKENLILSVARFASPSHSKRQDILIKAFKIFSETYKDYRLVLTGGFSGDESILSSLSKLAKGLKIDIITNPSFSELKELYAYSKYFWHAAGFDIDEEKEPEKVEHFGMTTVEAMSAGCVPVCIAKGGQKEIITSESGFLVNSADEIASTTVKIEKDKLFERYTKAAQSRSLAFSQSVFMKKVSEIIS